MYIPFPRTNLKEFHSIINETYVKIIYPLRDQIMQVIESQYKTLKQHKTETTEKEKCDEPYRSVRILILTQSMILQYRIKYYLLQCKTNVDRPSLWLDESEDARSIGPLLLTPADYTHQSESRSHDIITEWLLTIVSPCRKQTSFCQYHSLVYTGNKSVLETHLILHKQSAISIRKSGDDVWTPSPALSHNLLCLQQRWS